MAIIRYEEFIIEDTPLCRTVADRLMDANIALCDQDNISDNGTWAEVYLWDPRQLRLFPSPEGLRCIGVALHGNWLVIGYELERES